MVYRKRPPKSRRYKRSHSHDTSPDNSVPVLKEEENTKQVEALPPSQPETKAPKPFSFLSSLLGTGERQERSGSPLFTVFNYDIYFDDLLLAGLIILLLTDKAEDELLLIVLIYLLLDIF
jgi:hypothetical protein